MCKTGVHCMLRQRVARRAKVRALAVHVDGELQTLLRRERAVAGLGRERAQLGRARRAHVDAAVRAEAHVQGGGGAGALRVLCEELAEGGHGVTPQEKTRGPSAVNMTRGVARPCAVPALTDAHVGHSAGATLVSLGHTWSSTSVVCTGSSARLASHCTAVLHAIERRAQRGQRLDELDDDAVQRMAGVGEVAKRRS